VVKFRRIRRKAMKEVVFWSVAGLTLLTLVGIAVKASLNGNKKGHAARRKIEPEKAPAFEYRLFPISESPESAGSA
jgi:hypothetical protein